jgi:hypothetical protein
MSTTRYVKTGQECGCLKNVKMSFYKTRCKTYIYKGACPDAESADEGAPLPAAVNVDTALLLHARGE